MMYNLDFSPIRVRLAILLITFFCIGPTLLAQGENDEQSILSPGSQFLNTSLSDFHFNSIDIAKDNSSIIVADDEDDKKSDDDDDKKKDDDDDDGSSNSDCECEGKMQNFTVTYNGISGATVTGHKKKGDLFKTYNNVQNGDQLTFNGWGSKGKLDSKTFIKINGGSSTEIHTSCSIQIVGETYGAFHVDSYTDGEGNFCDGSDSPDDDDDQGGDDDDDDSSGGSSDDDDDNGSGSGGGSNGEDCQCEGKMENFTVTYNGTSGATIYAWDDKMDNLIATYSNVQNGDEITVNGFDDKGRLKAKTNLVIGNASYEVHTSCSVNILGEVYGPFNVISFTDGEGSFCDGTGKSATTRP